MNFGAVVHPVGYAVGSGTRLCLVLLGERRGGDVKAVSAPRNPLSAAILQILEDGLV
jgi:hypothetical protein